jgi:hypothetical protein
MRESTAIQRNHWMNCLGSLFSYNGGQQTLQAQSITVADFDQDAEDRKFEFHYVFPQGDVIPCKDCQLESFIDEHGNEFLRSFETEDHVFFINREEGDDNGNTMMFLKDSLELISNNHFASSEVGNCLAYDKATWRSEWLIEAMKEDYFIEYLNEWREVS